MALLSLVLLTRLLLVILTSEASHAGLSTLVVVVCLHLKLRNIVLLLTVLPRVRLVKLICLSRITYTRLVLSLKWDLHNPQLRVLVRTVRLLLKPTVVQLVNVKVATLTYVIILFVKTLKIVLLVYFTYQLII